MSTSIGSYNETPPAAYGKRRGSVAHPIRDLLIQRLVLGVLTIVIVSIFVFAATQLLPDNAARTVLGRNATPEKVTLLEKKMGLDQPPVKQYLHWVSGLVRGDFGNSLVNDQPVAQLTGPQLVNTATLVVTAGTIGIFIGVGLGLVAAIRRGRPIDQFLSVLSLATISLPEFVVAIFVTVLLATNVFHWFPAVSTIPPGERPWNHPSLTVLPILVLVIVSVPYIFQMMRAATIEALESEYVEMARLKGLDNTQILFRHALPNSVAATIQASGLTMLYLSGGVVVVEAIFNYSGVGLGLYNAVQGRDIPTIQFIVTLLAILYVVISIVTDLLVLLATPRKRFPR
ncbi:ABC transporter permease (plasmid) [Mesorhizobium sp. ORM8.1]